MAQTQSGKLFAATRWSIVMAAARAGDRANPGSAACTQALEELCRIYWYPLYAYLRRQGHPAAQAEDLIQGFFAKLIHHDSLADVSPEKGKFRSFLLVCLKRYVNSECEREGAIKRGGGQRVLSLDLQDAEHRYGLEPEDLETPERTFERNWALTVLGRALAALAGEFSSRGSDRAKVFEALKVYLAASDAVAPPYAETAGVLGMSETAVRVAVHRLRERYREAVEEELMQTMEQGASLDQEITELIAALGYRR